MKGIKKQNLPSKLCPVCQRPFVWRKKWSKDWPNVIYCSEKCQRSAKQIRRQNQEQP